MRLPIYQVDAFTDRHFGGNPAAVVPLENWLTDSLLQNIAAENNLSETAFFTKRDNDFHLRWFTPVCEVDLCGHATLATAHVLWRHLGYRGDVLRFYSRSGMLEVMKQGDFYTLDFPTDHLAVVDTPSAIPLALGLSPMLTLKGREDYLAVFENQAQVEKLSPDFRLLATLGARGLIATAPGREVDMVCRCFFPAFGIDEDPVTGSAHTSLTPYWAGRLGKTTLTSRQLSRRGGSLWCTLARDRTHIKGQAVTFLSGEIKIVKMTGD